MSAMTPVQHLLPHGLGAVLRKAPLSPEKVAFAWRLAVGPAVDKATTIELRERVLHVTTKGGGWAQELRRSAASIRQRLADLLGEDVVSYIEVASDVGRRPRT